MQHPIKILILILMTAVGTVQAGHSVVDSWLNTIENMNQGHEDLTQDCCKMDQASLSNQCALDLCGMSSEQESVYLNRENIQKIATISDRENDFKKFEPELIQYLAQQSQLNHKKKDYLLKHFERNPDYLAFKNFNMEEQNIIISNALASKHQILVDPNTKKIEISLDIEVQEHYPHLANNYKDSLTQYLLSQPNRLIEMGYYKKEEAREIVEKDILVNIETHFRKLKKENIFSADLQQIEKQIKSLRSEYEQLLYNFQHNSFDLAQMAQLYLKGTLIKRQVMAQVEQHIPDKKSKYQLNIPPDNNLDFKCHLTDDCLKYFNHTIKQGKNKLLQEQHEAKEQQGIIQSCRALWYTDQLLLPETQNIEEFKKMMPKIQEDMLQSSLSHLSTKSKKKLNKMMNNLKHKLPEAQKNYPYQQETKHFKEMVSQMNKNFEEHPDSINLTSDLNAYLTFEELADPYQFIKSLCTTPIMTLTDYFSRKIPFQKKSYLSISGYSCNQHVHGKSIYAHELGHAISYWISKNKMSRSSKKTYLDQRECITQNYMKSTDDLKYKTRHKNDQLHSEEDMADFISFTTYHDPKEKLYFCNILPKHKNGRDYQHLSLLPVPNSAHSTPLTRLLMEAIYRGVKLSSSCQKIIDESNENIQFRRCIP